MCRKNDGHLIRIVGPSFELVSRWAADGIPLTVAYKGIDRYFERYYSKGARRRPVRIDFCDADVRDVFDEWRRAVGLPLPEQVPAERGASLPAHLERVVMRLTSARAAGSLGPDADGVIDRIADDLDRARAASRGLRGAAREVLLRRLGEFDRELLTLARGALTPAAAAAIEAEASAELAEFRDTMPAEAYARAHAAAVDRLVRERAGLPVVVYA